MTGSNVQGHDGQRQASAAAGPEQVSISASELSRARRAYRGALDAAQAWRAFSSNPKHHDTTYWILLSSLFVEPGMNRTGLVDQIVLKAGVSRSTAERTVSDARESGLIVGESVGAVILLSLSDRLFKHCVDYFRNWMDAAKLAKALGYTEDYSG